MKRERSAGTAADIELIDKNDLCRQLKISPWTLQRKIAKGEFPRPVWLGPTTPRWRASEVAAWQADPARRERPKPKHAKKSLDDRGLD